MVTTAVKPKAEPASPPKRKFLSIEISEELYAEYRTAHEKLAETARQRDELLGFARSVAIQADGDLSDSSFRDYMRKLVAEVIP